MRKLLLLIAIFLLIPFFAEAKVYLVSVGIADYPGSGNDLNLPAKDAQTVTWLYSKNTSLQYCQLLDAKATVKNIVVAMDKVYANAGKDDIVVFFFSGHGYRGGFYAHDDKLPYKKIKAAMAKSKCKNKMIFADACFSGKIRTGGSLSQSMTDDIKNANIMLFLSSRGNETSIETPSMKNGFFTTYLQRGLRGAADTDRNRVITAKELFRYVHDNVVELSEGRQHPVMWGNFSDNMPVMKW